MDISVENNIAKIYKGSADEYTQPLFDCYSILALEYYKFTGSFDFEMKIGGVKYPCAFANLTISGVAPYDFDVAYEELSLLFNPLKEPTPL